MPKLTIDNLQPGTLDGDTLYETAEKVNANFNEIYTVFGDGTTLSQAYTALQGLNAGLIVSQGLNTYTSREIKSLTSSIQVTNGTGAQGDPTIDLSPTGVLPAGSAPTLQANQGFTVDVQGRITALSTPTLLPQVTAQADAASASASTASTKAGEAAASATTAANDVATIGTSLSQASTHATNAGNSASAASTSASTATTQAGLATTNGAAQVALATTQAGLATTNGQAQVTLATAQVALATTQAGLATTNGQAQVTLATAQVALAEDEKDDAVIAKNASVAAKDLAVTAKTDAETAKTAAETAKTASETAKAASETAKTAAETASTSAAASFDSFDDRYLGAKSSEPTVDNDGNALITGTLYFNSSNNTMFVRTSGGSWANAGSAVNGTTNRTSTVATAGQTAFSIVYDIGFVDVYLNGIKLSATDFGATNGTQISLSVGASVGDQVDCIGYGAFELANTYTVSAMNAILVGKAPLSNANFAGGASAPSIGGATIKAIATSGAYTDLSGKPDLSILAPINNPNFTGTAQIGGATIPVVTGHIANISAGANGSLPYQTGSNATTFLGIGSADQVLKVAGGVPVWGDAEAGGGTVEVVATGTLTTGQTVIIKSDGTASAISGGVPAPTAGTITTFKTGSMQEICVTYAENNDRVIVAYKDPTNFGYGTIVSGQISGTTITFGTPYQFESDTVGYLDICYQPVNQRIVAFYQKNESNTFIARYKYIEPNSNGTFSNLGDGTVNANQSQDMQVVYCPNQDRVVVSWKPYQGTQYLRMKVGSCSSNSILFGTTLSINTSNSIAQPKLLAEDAGGSTDKVVCFFLDVTDSQKVKAVVASISGTTATYQNTTTVTGSPIGNYLAACYDKTNDRFICGYNDTNDSSHGKLVVGTLSGTTLTFGAVTEFIDDTMGNYTMVHDATANNIAVIGRDDGNGQIITAELGSSSGTLLDQIGTVNSPHNFDINSPNTFASVYHADFGKIFIAYKGYLSGNHTGVGLVLEQNSFATNLTSDNFLGFSSASYTNGQTATIQTTGSFNVSQTGLTAGLAYYASGLDGSLTTSSASPNVKAGLAISATKIKIA